MENTSLCKKIRDDDGFGTNVETCVTRHSTAKFSHGLCPDFLAKYYGEINEEDAAD